MKSTVSQFLSSVSESHLLMSMFPLTGYASNITAQPNYDYTTFSPSAVYFACDSYSYYLSECSFSPAYTSVCQSHQYDAYLTCTIGMNYTSQFFNICVCKLSACIVTSSVHYHRMVRERFVYCSVSILVQFCCGKILMIHKIYSIIGKHCFIFSLTQT